jgi:hypothetical protein
MPSEELTMAGKESHESDREGRGPTDRALEALTTQREAFHSALVVTIDQLRGQLEAGVPTDKSPGERAALRLGHFGAGRIDPNRFAGLMTESERRDVSWVEPATEALRTLEEVSARGDDLFRVSVAEGDDLYSAVDAALADAGRAFGAARLVELARTRRYVPEHHDSLLVSFPFRRWSRTERAKAPPLVVDVGGGDLVVGGLAAFLDGAEKIVLVVRGGSPPAPLVRLVTPGILVMQTADPAELELLGTTAGPAIAALVPAEAGQFVHDPAEEGRRLEVSHLPDTEPTRALGQVSAFHQAEELRLLRAMAAGEAAPVREPGTGTPAGDGAGPAAPTEAPSEPVDLLAAWLLRQADLSDLDSASG